MPPAGSRLTREHRDRIQEAQRENGRIQRLEISSKLTKALRSGDLEAEIELVLNRVVNRLRKGLPISGYDRELILSLNRLPLENSLASRNAGGQS